MEATQTLHQKLPDNETYRTLIAKDRRQHSCAIAIQLAANIFRQTTACNSMSSHLTQLINVLLHIGHYKCTYDQNFDFKIKWDHQKNSNKRRVYESVDDNSIS